MMQAVRLKAVLSDDRRLEIVVPEEIPLGEVEVIVLASSPTATGAQQTLDELFVELDRMPHKRLTTEEINQYLAGEWGSWD
jgi:hypothetical protein